MAFVGILSQTKLLFGTLVIQLVWYILKQLFTSVSVKVVDTYLHFGDLIIVKYGISLSLMPMEICIGRLYGKLT